MEEEVKQAFYTDERHSRSRGLGSMGLLRMSWELNTVPEEIGHGGKQREQDGEVVRSEQLTYPAVVPPDLGHELDDLLPSVP